MGYGGPRYGYQPVDTNDFRLLEKDIETDAEASQLTNSLNTKKYLQQEEIESDGVEMNLAPSSTEKEFIDGAYRFYVVQVDPEDPTSLRWTWEQIKTVN